MSNEMKSFLNLLYSLARQYISWYETHIKNATPVGTMDAKPNGKGV